MATTFRTHEVASIFWWKIIFGKYGILWGMKYEQKKWEKKRTEGDVIYRTRIFSTILNFCFLFRAILLKGIDSFDVLGKIQFFLFGKVANSEVFFVFWWKNEGNSDVERKKRIPCTFFGHVAGVVSGGEIRITRRIRTMMKMGLKNKKENVV